MDLCSSERKFVQFQKWLKPSSYVNLNTSKILRLWFNYYNWQLYIQLHTWTRNLYEYENAQGERNSRTLREFFMDATITGRNNRDSDSAAESDNDDNADDRWWLRKDSLTVFSWFINRIADKLQQHTVKSQGVYFIGHGVQLHSVCVE